MEEKQKLPTDRSFPMYVLLDIITGHIYQAFMLSKMSKEINIVAQDGKKTMNYMKLFLVMIGAGLLFALGFWVKSMIITKISYVLLFALTIFLFIWLLGISDRIGKELKRREVNYKFGASTFVTYFLIPIGQKLLRPTLVSMYSYMQPIVATTISIGIGMDTLGPKKVIAAITVFAGVILVNYSRAARKQG